MVLVGVGVSVGRRVGVTVEVTVGVGVTVSGSGVLVGVAVGDTVAVGVGSSLLVSAKMLRLPTSALAFCRRRSTVVGNCTHPLPLPLECCITILDASSRAALMSSSVKSIVTVMFFWNV